MVAYAPTENVIDQEKDHFYRMLECAMKLTPDHAMLLSALVTLMQCRVPLDWDMNEFWVFFLMTTLKGF